MDRDQIGSVCRFRLRSGSLKTHRLELDAARHYAINCARSAGFELADSTAREETWSTVIKRAPLPVAHLKTAPLLFHKEGFVLPVRQHATIGP